MPHSSVTAQSHPDRPAYIMAGSGEVVTYAQLDERANKGAQLFRALGVNAGDHIALMLKNCREFMEIAAAAHRAGIFYTPISTHLREEETAYIIDNCGAKLFIAGQNLTDVASKAATAAPNLEKCFAVGGDIAGFESWEAAVSEMPGKPIVDQCPGAPMLYSSGTTGKPKGVFQKPTTTDIHEPHFLEATMGALFGFDASCIYLSPAPLYHAAPLHYNNLVLACGATSIIMEHFDAEQALAHIEHFGVTHSQWVPIMLVRMLKLPLEVRERYDVSSMKRAIHAAAPCPIEVKEQMIDWWGPVIEEYYAASESIGGTIIGSQDWLAHKGSVGRPIFGEPVIVDDEGNELPTGETGLIYFSAPTTFEYYKEPEKTQEAFNDKGWATTGDMGYLDAEGYLYLTDRKNFMIISGGVNIYPAEIENLLITHPSVADVAVFGIPNEEFGEEVKAVVQLDDMTQAGDDLAQALIEWMRERLSHIKVPRSIDFMAQLPRMDNGKLYKRHLVEQYKNP